MQREFMMNKQEYSNMGMAEKKVFSQNHSYG